MYGKQEKTDHPLDVDATNMYQCGMLLAELTLGKTHRSAYLEERPQPEEPDACAKWMDDMADLMADQEEINEMMTRNFGVEFDENELMDELAELDAEIMDEQLDLPSYVPQG